MIYDSIVLETRDDGIKRGKIEISKKDNTLAISIRGNDLVASRSLFNSLMRVVKTSYDITQIIDSEK